jgi:phenylacetic acid degradation operon negative regulatory protein
MKKISARTELFLYSVAYAIHPLLFPPSVFRPTESFEAWASRNGMLRQIQRLEAQSMLEKVRRENYLGAVRLTEQGRELSIFNLDPHKEWNRGWDGEWHLIMYDVEENQGTLRRELRHALANLKFGLLQKSVWISPRPLTAHNNPFSGNAKTNPARFVHFVGRPGIGLSDQEIAARAWDWTKLGQLQRRYRDHLKKHEQVSTPEQWQNWLGEELRLWKAILHLDPLLPRQLHPEAYLGPKIVADRIETFAAITRQTRHLNVRSDK